jgi:hypothetical protein
MAEGVTSGLGWDLVGLLKAQAELSELLLGRFEQSSPILPARSEYPYISAMRLVGVDPILV